MDSRNPVLITVGALCLFLIVASGAVYFLQSFETSEDRMFSFLEQSRNDVTELSLTQGSTTARITKSEGGWFYEGRQVDETKLVEFLTALARAEAQLVARSGRDTLRYGLASPRVLNLVVKDEPRMFDIGGTDNRTGGTYVARSGDGAVYLLSGSDFSVRLTPHALEALVAATSTSADGS